MLPRGSVLMGVGTVNTPNLSEAVNEGSEAGGVWGRRVDPTLSL